MTEAVLLEVLSLRVGGEPQKALLLCMKAVTESPDNVQLRLELARLYCILGFFPFAENELVSLASILPNNKFIHKLLAMLRSGDDLLQSNSDGGVSAISEKSMEEVFADIEIDVDLLNQD